ncbi:DUF423 domain-containing protein [Ulvibacter antarcticus]|uniref:Uncharacterized membrane protein YgdD (TMEM256/DUF423 family) n=1 Tax=Ulvibacter antarcticus TaxID=442714 RepID=A0A3L9Z2H8_9FLAO|nr:DUF423 domain-containing protein [Ulvibacter antarcticus]RMA66340.1 uncharacterized membrane protein YgdD (TMEM256/DUF423 family) [Ulvibacter antarcticus]
MNKFDKKIVVVACILAAITIGLGAFGAHGLKEMLSQESLSTFETGVRYQMYHSLAILILGLSTQIPSKVKKIVFWFFLFGIIFFSGSIYLLSIKQLLSFNVSFLGPITPIGGLLFILGWLRLGYGLLTIKRG